MIHAIGKVVGVSLEEYIAQSGIREVPLADRRRRAARLLDGPILVFLHLPKTGGSSQWHTIAASRPPNLSLVDLFSLDDSSLTAGEVSDRVADRVSSALSRWGEEQSNRILLHHHALVPLPSSLSLAPKIITVREPMEVLVSAYWASKERTNFRGSLSQFVEASLDGGLWNEQFCGFQSIALQAMLEQASCLTSGGDQSAFYPVSLRDYAGHSRIWEAVEWVLGAELPVIHYPGTVTRRLLEPLSDEDAAFLRSQEIADLLAVEYVKLRALYEAAHGGPR